MIKKIMTAKKFEANVEARQNIKLQIEALKAELESIEDSIKAHFEAVGVDTIIAGNRKVTYKPVNSHKLDSTGLKAAYPDIFTKFYIPNPYMKLTVR